MASNHSGRRGNDGCVSTMLAVATIEVATQAQSARKPTRTTIIDDVEGPHVPALAHSDRPDSASAPTCIQATLQVAIAGKIDYVK